MVGTQRGSSGSISYETCHELIISLEYLPNKQNAKSWNYSSSKAKWVPRCAMEQTNCVMCPIIPYAVHEPMLVWCWHAFFCLMEGRGETGNRVWPQNETKKPLEVNADNVDKSRCTWSVSTRNNSYDVRFPGGRSLVFFMVKCIRTVKWFGSKIDQVYVPMFSFKPEVYRQHRTDRVLSQAKPTCRQCCIMLRLDRGVL